MKQIPLIEGKHQRLLLFFAGWSMDEHPFADYRPEHHDFTLCYDYRTMEWNEQSLAHYQSIDIVAWSMGVWAAGQVLNGTQLPVNQCTAVNGTPYIVDEQRGLPEALFNGTLNGLSETSLLKFQRRMCGQAQAYEHFRLKAPQRPVAELKEELKALKEAYIQEGCAPFIWDKAYIGTEDRIFSPQSQHRAWDGQTEVCEVEAAHYDETLLRTLITQHP